MGPNMEHYEPGWKCGHSFSQYANCSSSKNFYKLEISQPWRWCKSPGSNATVAKSGDKCPKAWWIVWTTMQNGANSQSLKVSLSPKFICFSVLECGHSTALWGTILTSFVSWMASKRVIDTDVWGLKLYKNCNNFQLSSTWLLPNSACDKFCPKMFVACVKANAKLCCGMLRITIRIEVVKEKTIFCTSSLAVVQYINIGRALVLLFLACRWSESRFWCGSLVCWITEENFEYTWHCFVN